MPEDALERLSGFDEIYLGAVGWPTVPDHVLLWSLCSLSAGASTGTSTCARQDALADGAKTPDLGGSSPAEEVIKAVIERPPYRGPVFYAPSPISPEERPVRSLPDSGRMEPNRA